MNQFSRAMDNALNRLSRIIGDAEKVIESATATKDATWEEVKSLFAEVDKDRFIANDGYTLSLGTRQGTPKLDEAMLERLLKEHLGPTYGRVWNAITERKVNSLLLEQAKNRGQIPAELIEQCITMGPSSDIRYHRPWTKEDKEHAVILGVEVTDDSRESRSPART